MPHPRNKNSRSKRELIMAAAVDLLLANGYERTSMDAVAAKAGVSKTTVYAHFSDKLELFHAVMTHAASDFALDLGSVVESRSVADPLEQLTSVLLEVVKAASAPELTAYFRVLIAEIDRRSELQAMSEQVQSDMPDVIRIIASLIVKVAATRGYVVEDPERYATLLVRMTAPGTQFDILVANFRPSDEILAAHIGLIVRIFFDGIGPKDSDTKAVNLPPLYLYPIRR
ncbi:TetR family transcriptional regulator [Agrobacterium vitis]|uniref:TetR family transcriptional regulator n=2 Tax=Agrobacterium vitis TaxID=373 RepID=A0ABD6GG99_AGRVI|nr:TetR family transcriptional regulator [Agrobacterium vitis]MUO94436.1 TetR family transcriptional regulator [Agrobacterium vitis]MUP06095.1 TetR family transcriptional regulator [Agrobacterium vitis]MUZ82192.1 TetR family transcriptional regulator [Agrobacterium vitis]MVA11447.1 TetR family transcriptional regulator [Agrobacterium vitis]